MLGCIDVQCMRAERMNSIVNYQLSFEFVIIRSHANEYVMCRLTPLFRDTQWMVKRVRCQNISSCYSLR
jgi:hypothetical protein